MSLLTDSLCFDIVGSLITSQGIIPTFTRFTPANSESTVNGSLRIFAAATHQPRFTSTGAILLEQSSTNRLTYPLDLTHSSWVKGSSMVILPDRVQAMDNNYLADLISVAVYTGNQAAQTLTKSFTFESAKTFTATVYLNLLGGRFGGNDKLQITGDVIAPQTVSLGPIFNDRVGNYIPVTMTFTTAGTPPTNYFDPDTLRTVNLQLYVEKAVSIAWGGAQLEAGAIRSTFINQDAQSKSRDDDVLIYPKSPVEGLSSFVFYMNLEAWRGNGTLNLVNAGNFKVEIVDGKLKASCGTVECTDPDDLPATAKIAVRVSQGLAKVQLYVNGVMKARQTISNYAGQVSTVAIAGPSTGMCQIRCLYFFNRDIGDGSIDVGQSVLSTLLELHSLDANLITDLAEGFSRVIFPAIRVPVGGIQAVRFPQFLAASQTISAITPGSGSVAQVERVTIDTIVSGSASQTDFIIINDTKYDNISDATPTGAEIASGFATKVNTSPRSQPVTAAYTSGSSFTLTADKPGDDFALSVSPRLSKVNLTPNSLDASLVSVPNAVDFVRGKAQIYRNYAFVADVIITNVNTGTNQLTVSAIPNSIFSQVQVGDTILQPSWSLLIGPNNFFCHHLEDFPDIKIHSKSPEGFALKNVGLLDRSVTPYAKVTL